MYRNPRPNRFFNPRAIQMNRPIRPPFGPGGASNYPFDPTSQLRFQSGSSRGHRGSYRGRFPRNRGPQKQRDYDFNPRSYFKESMLQDPWRKLKHIIQESTDDQGIQPTAEEYIEKESVDTTEEIVNEPAPRSPIK
ncbi:hypothetical protein TrispH2_004846 [Trichoplax sp. H2]|uniref:Uncharacterized protein n=1 Tax=Trichoplax adhaerens TaxID=10228 RepID=B3RQG4_TRIAD|nr:predicted protein [Trichoplax adhaerens]EDV26696.1 predicted protein [Trichoplax adhaerens]RDD42690.1 hypothetical protein TrispH2_004846 [Trichoplax sp. H2]|eukprot:XP_002110692.1 predicted protein [Trichoplax adhaerens]